MSHAVDQDLASALEPVPVGRFNRYARYYDLFYRQKDYAGEAAFVHEVLGRHAASAVKRVLDLGCGTGKHALRLVERGLSVYGVDVSPAMLDVAWENRTTLADELAGRLTFSQGDIRRLHLGCKFDAVICLFHVVSYQAENRDLEATFETARALLDRGGLFVFDCWYGPAVLTQRPMVRVQRWETEDAKITRLAEPVLRSAANAVDVQYTLFVQDKNAATCEQVTELHRMRYLFLPELESLLERTGFGMVECREWMSDREPTTDAWSVYCVARAQ